MRREGKKSKAGPSGQDNDEVEYVSQVMRGTGRVTKIEYVVSKCMGVCTMTTFILQARTTPITADRRLQHVEDGGGHGRKA
jgi:hypothetical protein